MDEQHTYQKKFLYNSLAILMGGRCAEEICLGEMTTGAGNDIERATEMARKMVCEWGMSEKMGPLSYGSKEEQVFLGRDFSNQQTFSDQTAKLIDQEIKALVMGGYDRATEILKTNNEILENLAQALLERETLTGDQVRDIIAGKDLTDSDSSDGESQKIEPEVPAEKLKSKTDPDEGLLGGGGMPDPSPA
jgi:cell division protease FtsH